MEFARRIYGEDKQVIMFGGLHIEMAAFRTISDLLDGSGWTSALVEADVITPGTADSFLKASHLTRTRHVHQVTASSLYYLTAQFLQQIQRVCLWMRYQNNLMCGREDEPTVRVQEYHTGI